MKSLMDEVSYEIVPASATASASSAHPEVALSRMVSVSRLESL